MDVTNYPWFNIQYTDMCVCVHGLPNAGDAGDMTSIPWRRTWQLAPVFLPGEFQARGVQWAISMGSQESDMTE